LRRKRGKRSKMRLKNIFYLILTAVLLFNAPASFSQVDTTKFGTIKVRKHKKDGDTLTPGNDNAGKDIFYKGARITASYKYYLIDTITSVDTSNLPNEDKCIPCWPKGEIANWPKGQIDNSLKNVRVLFPALELGRYLLKNLTDTISITGFDSTIKKQTADTLEIGFLLDSKGKLYDFIYPISKTNNNSFLLPGVSWELNRINREPRFFNQYVVKNKGMVSLEKTKKKRFSWLRKKKKNKKDTINFYCYVRIILNNATSTPINDDYLKADNIMDCEKEKVNKTEYDLIIKNARDMVDPILKTRISKGNKN